MKDRKVYKKSQDEWNEFRNKNVNRAGKQGNQAGYKKQEAKGRKWRKTYRKKEGRVKEWRKMRREDRKCVRRKCVRS